MPPANILLHAWSWTISTMRGGNYSPRKYSVLAYNSSRRTPSVDTLLPWIIHSVVFPLTGGLKCKCSRLMHMHAASRRNALFCHVRQVLVELYWFHGSYLWHAALICVLDCTSVHFRCDSCRPACLNRNRGLEPVRKRQFCVWASKLREHTDVNVKELQKAIAKRLFKYLNQLRYQIL